MVIQACIPFEEVRTWLFDEALPFWSDTGVDQRYGGFVEHLDLYGRPAEVNFKRVRVQARQIFCFCRAKMLGWNEAAALQTAERGYDFLVRHAWLGADRGWARRLARSGEVIDPTPDLYDIAFVLLALAYWYRVTSDRRAVELAQHSLDFVRRRMRHPSGLGFLHEIGAGAPYQQNPHMHLIEALIALGETTGMECFVSEAGELYKLLSSKFVQPRTSSLAEFFDADWKRDSGELGKRVEPGHHFEWVWILHRYSALAGVDVSLLSQKMFNFANQFGSDDKTGLIYDVVAHDGTPIDRDHRSWPQTEAIKAWLTLFERQGIDPTSPVSRLVRNLFRYFIRPAPRGTWIDHVTHDGAPRVDKIPSSTFYHLVLGFSEILRLEPAIVSRTVEPSPRDRRDFSGF